MRRLAARLRERAADAPALTAAAAGAAFLPLLVGALRWGQGGWDHGVYCAAVQVVAQGGNPYAVAEIQAVSGLPLAFAYLPLTLPAWAALCPLGLAGWNAIGLASLAGAVLVAHRTRSDGDVLWTATLLATGLGAAFWNLHTGNVGLPSLLVFAGAALALARGRGLAAGALVGLLGALKLFPLAFAGLFLLRPGAWRRKLGPMAAAAGAAVAVHAASWLAYPALTEAYHLRLLGRAGGTAASEQVVTNVVALNNPSALLLTQAVTDQLTSLGVAAGTALYGLLVVGLGAAYLAWLRGRAPAFGTAFAVGVLALLLVQPRLKPYSFVYALVPLHRLTAGARPRLKAAVLASAAVYPLLAHLAMAVLGWGTALAGVPGGAVLWILLSFSQWLGLAAALGLLVAADAEARLAGEPADDPLDPLRAWFRRVATPG